MLLPAVVHWKHPAHFVDGILTCILCLHIPICHGERTHQGLETVCEDVIEVYEPVEGRNYRRFPGRLLERVCRVIPIFVVHLQWEVQVETGG
jgi:hypothetical protein